ncbi:MAG: deoxyribodipyrimidine photo-lyase [Verrucomicrobiota bacterium]
MLSIVWFKRDLRIEDHLPLCAATEQGSVICLYVYEDELLESEEFDSAHLVFINQSLSELDHDLQERGGKLIIRRGAMPEVLHDLYREHNFDELISHEETGNWLTYDRDRRVAEWCRSNGVKWKEIPQNGVERPNRSRDGWASRWNRRMREEPVPPPEWIETIGALYPGAIMEPADLGLPASSKTEAKSGGESQARSHLESFLSERGVNYRKDMSSPVEGWEGCSRLSPYLAWGNISIRTVYHALNERKADVKWRKAEGLEIDSRWNGSLQSFGGRLRWHCHFMQKLEDEPEIEFHNMNRGYDGLRESEFDDERFSAWCRGETGYPMVDACMRALLSGGWINFRMRAMLVSFSSYHLWLHWRRPAIHLAKHFLDFEPGIHFSQVQMQSGVTGINAIRIYSPIKQVIDQDPKGQFIRKYVPGLAEVPDTYLAEPHKMPMAEQMMARCVIGKDYPEPIVDHKTAYVEAKRRMYTAKGAKQARAEAKRVYQKHGSRRRTSTESR